MKITVLEQFDSDGNPSVEVYVDGKRADSTIADVETVDPGRGWEWEDWFERIKRAYERATSDDATEFDNDFYIALLWGARSQYVSKPDGWEDELHALIGEPLNDALGI